MFKVQKNAAQSFIDDKGLLAKEICKDRIK